jgi:hypothetical protein
VRYVLTFLPHPPYSPDFASLYFHFLGCLKDLICRKIFGSKDEVSEEVIMWLRVQNSDLKRRNKWSCFLLTQGCWILRRLCRKTRFATDTSSYSMSTLKELYNRLLAIKIVLQRFLCKLRMKGINFDLKIFKIQHTFLPRILHDAPTIHLNLIKCIMFGRVHTTHLITKQFPETYSNFKDPSIFVSTS